MGWVDSIGGSVVGLDTTPLIYYIEANPAYIAMLDPFFDALDRGEFTVVTSYITLLEVLVHPLKHGNADLAEQYRTILLNSPHVQSLPVSATIAEEAAQLRATHNIRTPDAIQMATARHAGATHFVTNDIKLPDLPGMALLVLDRLRANLENQPSA